MVACECGTTFTLTFDVTDAEFNGTTVSVCVSNGFHTVVLEMPITLNNVVVFGKAGHGKSTLVRAMRACAEGQPYPSEVPRASLGVNPESLSESFTKEKLTVYEAVGVGNNDDVHRKVVERALSKMPPRVIVIVWKYGEVLDDQSKDFHNMVRQILDGVENLRSRHQVHVFLVLTQCDKKALPAYREQYEKTAEELKQKFGMSSRTQHFIINSADAWGDQSKVVGVKEFYSHVKETLKASIPLQSVIQIGTLWSQLRPYVVEGAVVVGLTGLMGVATYAGVPGARPVMTAISTAAMGHVAVVGVSNSSEPTRRLYKWMYGDPSTGRIAEMNRLRWSSSQSATATVTELRSLMPPNQTRPIILVDNKGEELRSACASDVITFLETTVLATS